MAIKNDVKFAMKKAFFRNAVWEYTSESIVPKRDGLAYTCRKCGNYAYSSPVAIDHGQVEYDDEMVDCPVPSLAQQHLGARNS